MLGKGETRRVKDLAVTFKEYSIGQHGAENQGGMLVAAQIEVSTGGDTYTLSPAVEHSVGEDGKTLRTQRPDSLVIAGKTYFVHLKHIMADQGVVAISIPGLIDQSPEQLVLDISKKPLINFVWIGSILIMVGSLITFLRRREEMYAPQKAAQERASAIAEPSRT